MATKLIAKTSINRKRPGEEIVIDDDVEAKSLVDRGHADFAGKVKAPRTPAGDGKGSGAQDGGDGSGDGGDAGGSSGAQ